MQKEHPTLSTISYLKLCFAVLLIRKSNFSGLILLSFAKADARKEQDQDVQQVRLHQGLISVVYQSK